MLYTDHHHCLPLAPVSMECVAIAFRIFVLCVRFIIVHSVVQCYLPCALVKYFVNRIAGPMRVQVSCSTLLETSEA